MQGYPTNLSNQYGTPATDPTPRPLYDLDTTDAEICATWAGEALIAGRIELGAALARIAQAADAHDRLRQQEVVRNMDTLFSGAQPKLYPAEQPTVTIEKINSAIIDPPTRILEHGRCQARVINEVGLQEECRIVCVQQPDGWAHLHPVTDGHVPVI
jgi:hypothetical protein